MGVVAACSSTSAVPKFAGLLPLGNWGGDSAAMIVSDTAMHLHIGCTYGDVSGRIPVNEDGSIDMVGSYMLHAYPVAVGPSVPARFVGRWNGSNSSLTVTATVYDTTQNKTVTRGPVTITLGQDPKLMPCPICRRPIVTKAQATKRRLGDSPARI
jgi:hypothetical protein